MSAGKFEAGKNGRPAAKSSAGGRSAGAYAVKKKPAQTGKSAASRRGNYAAPKKSASKLLPVLAAAIGVVVLVLGVLVAKKIVDSRKSNSKDPNEVVAQSTSEYVPEGISRAELEAQAREISAQLKSTDMVLQFQEAGQNAEEKEEPIVVNFGPGQTKADLDLAQLQADLDEGVGKTGEDLYAVDLAEYLTMDREALEALVDETVAQYGTEFSQMKIEEQTEREEVLNDSGALETKNIKYLVIHTGVTGRTIDRDTVLEALDQAYLGAIRGESETPFLTELSYQRTAPEQPDVEALYEQYCSDPKDAAFDENTYEIIPDEPGYGFDKDMLRRELKKAGEGKEVRVRLDKLQADVTARFLQDSLFRDVLAEAHTPHSAVAARTNNLKLACEAINGTILLPGETFSFNKVVGERTAEKGYMEAITFAGGQTKPELGGGVCQVASSIYYAVLYADLETVERDMHFYKVDYVPMGMDAAIYYGSQDYKFKNSSPYPIKIEASVYGGKVHIILWGTEWKDYTIKMDYKVLETIPYQEVVKDYPKDSGYKEGEAVTTAYTGYVVESYKTRLNLDGTERETVFEAKSTYHKRDKIYAHLVDTTPQPTQPTTPPTQPPTQPPTEPPTQPTEPPTQPTEPPTQPTDPPDPEPSEDGGEG